uniref:Uncharacterized protein n=1 Tax=viral metagenome TaxID=1070528 RepID=A0A6C0JZD9_9ZZZZ
MNDDLDMSWIKEYSRIHSIQQIMNREEIDSIVLQTVYMNANLEISKINKETLKLDTNDHHTNKRCISKEQLLQIVQTKKVIEKTKYKVFDMLLFTIDLDPKDIQKYVNGECSENLHLKSIPIIDDIIIPPSLFIFHSLHTVFLFFAEIAEEMSIKSILKNSQNDNKKAKHTKKVRISEDDNIIVPRKMVKKTRKIWYDQTTIPGK